MKTNAVMCVSLAAALLITVGCATTGAPCAESSTASAEPTFGNDPPPPASEGNTPADVAATASDSDPVHTDGDKYRVVLENERVRVLRYQDHPGDKTNLHHHPEFVLYALSSFRRRLHFPDGTSKERDFVAGDVIWMADQFHIGENTGTTDTDVVIVERKQ